MYEKVVRVENVSGHALPRHSCNENECPDHSKERPCPYHEIPRCDGVEYRFEKDEIKFLDAKVGKHLRNNWKGSLVIRGKEVDLQALITMATKDPATLEKLMRAKPGQKIEVSLAGTRKEVMGETISDIASETRDPKGSKGDRVSVHNV